VGGEEFVDCCDQVRRAFTFGASIFVAGLALVPMSVLRNATSRAP